jgi:glycosyltransferase involved in cell wall biosynthesis
MNAAPLLSVIVPSHERPMRLRWLLNAMAEQTLDRSQWELVVCDDSRSDAVRELLDGHSLTSDGTLRVLRMEPGAGSASRQRNAAWRAARAELILFTDDDCRPPADWLANALQAAREHPGAIIQGATSPDPDEQHLVAAPHARTQAIDPPVPWAQTCNVLYPRAVLEAADGFEENMPAGEDTELAMRAQREQGVAYVGAPAMRTHHAVEAGSLRGKLRTLPRWRGLALVLKRNPQLRSELYGGVFWRASHAWLPVALIGLLRARRTHGVSLLLLIPYVLVARGSYGNSLRGRIRAFGDIPGRAVVDATETAVMARGSIEQRTLIL